jgi:hypothetical protein
LFSRGFEVPRLTLRVENRGVGYGIGFAAFVCIAAFYLRYELAWSPVDEVVRSGIVDPRNHLISDLLRYCGADEEKTIEIGVKGEALHHELDLLVRNGLADVCLRVFAGFQIGVDEPDVESDAVPGAPGPGVGEIRGAHDADPLRLGLVPLCAQQDVVVAIGGIADDVARLEDAGGSGVRHVRVRNTGY